MKSSIICQNFKVHLRSGVYKSIGTMYTHSSYSFMNDPHSLIPILSNLLIYTS